MLRYQRLEDCRWRRRSGAPSTAASACCSVCAGSGNATASTDRPSMQGFPASLVERLLGLGEFQQQMRQLLLVLSAGIAAFSYFSLSIACSSSSFLSSRGLLAGSRAAARIARPGAPAGNGAASLPCAVFRLTEPSAFAFAGILHHRMFGGQALLRVEEFAWSSAARSGRPRARRRLRSYRYRPRDRAGPPPSSARKRWRSFRCRSWWRRSRCGSACAATRSTRRSQLVMFTTNCRCAGTWSSSAGQFGRR